jgi:hypothetical protein
MPIVIKALRKLNVVVRVITDFDVLNDTNPLKQIYEDLDGTWTTIENDWKLVKESIDKKRPDLEASALKNEIDKILDSCENIVPNEKVSEIKNKLKKSSPWSIAKGVGKSYIPSGDPTKACERIQTKLREKGLHIVEVGQLEGFCRSIGNHGPKWVIEVMARDLKNDEELENARNFIQDVIR